MKSKICSKKFLSVSALMVSLCSYSSEQQQVLSESELKDFFSSIVAEETNVVFTFNKSGSRFVYRIDQQGSQVSEYGERVSLSCHSTFKVFDRHLSLTFTPLTDRQKPTTMKFSVLCKNDFRSMGADISTNSACLVSVSEPTGKMARAAQPTKDRCLYGLQLLPLAPQGALSQ